MLCKDSSSKTNSLRTLEGGGDGGEEEKASEAKTYTRADLRCTDDEEDQIKQEVVEEAVVHKNRMSKAESWR